MASKSKKPLVLGVVLVLVVSLLFVFAYRPIATPLSGNFSSREEKHKAEEEYAAAVYRERSPGRGWEKATRMHKTKAMGQIRQTASIEKLTEIVRSRPKLNLSKEIQGKRYLDGEIDISDSEAIDQYFATHDININDLAYVPPREVLDCLLNLSWESALFIATGTFDTTSDNGEQVLRNWHSKLPSSNHIRAILVEAYESNVLLKLDRKRTPKMVEHLELTSGRIIPKIHKGYLMGLVRFKYLGETDKKHELIVYAVFDNSNQSWILDTLSISPIKEGERNIRSVNLADLKIEPVIELATN